MRMGLIATLWLAAWPALASTPALIGGRRDAHGCLGPAGYTWCARERRCVRPWELAEQRGFPNTPRAFRRWCETRRR